MTDNNAEAKGGSRSLRPRTEAWLILVLCVVAIVPYVNTLPNQFTYDDKGIFLENPNFTKLKDVSNFFRQNYFEYAKEQSYRPIVTLTYLADYLAWGLAKPPWGYHLTNLLLNVAAILLVFLLVRSMSGDAWIGFVTGLIFALHPIHTEAIDSIGFREDLLVSVFYLLALYFYSLGERGKKAVMPLIVSNVCYAAALLSKEMALSLPIVLVVYDVILRRDRLKSWRGALVRYAPYLAITLLYGVLRFWALRTMDENPPRWAGESFWANALTMIGVVGYYVRLLFVPTPLQIEYNFPPVTSVGDVRLILGLGVICLFVFLGIYFARRAPLVGFGIFFFFIALLPVLNIVPLRYYIAERYLYLPSLGFALGMGYALTRIGERRTELLVLCIVAIIYGIVIVGRNAEWKNDRTLWTATLERNPNSKKAHYGMGIYYYANGMYDKAIDEFNTAIKIDPGYAAPRLYLGAAYHVTHRYDEAIREFRRVVLIAPKEAQGHHNLGLAYGAKGMLEDAIVAFKKAITLDPDNWRYHRDLGIAYMKHGDYDEAGVEFEKAARMNPRDAQVRELIQKNEEQKQRGKP